MRRIVVLGSTGSGKSTFARELSQHLNLPHIELDALHWDSNWTAAPTPLFRTRIAAATSADAWIIDGNYSAVRDAIWHHADTFIWLDYPMTLVFTRLLNRTLRRWWISERLWNENHENLWEHFFSTNSLFLWLIHSWRTYRRDYPRLLRSQQQQGKTIHRFRHPNQTTTWLRTIKAHG